MTAGPPSINVLASGVYLPLPMSDCAISLPAGTIRLTLLNSYRQQQAPVQVTGAPEGHWENQAYVVNFDLAQGEVRKVSLDVGAYSANTLLTYTFTGAPAIGAVLASGPSRQGPWTAVSGSVVPPEATWLRITYPRPLKASSPSIVTDDPYARPGEGLPGDWEGDRVQYVAIGNRKPVLVLGEVSDQNGLPMRIQGVDRLYRGAPPELQRLDPTTGSVRRLYQSTKIPWQLRMVGGQVLWLDGVTATAIDPSTGQAAPAGRASDAPTPGPAEHYTSPDGKWVAELSYPDGPPQPSVTGGHWTVSVTIRESGSGKVLIQRDRAFTTWGLVSCGMNSPGLGWRADSQTLAVLDAPTQDLLAVKEIDLSGAIRTITEWSGPGQSGWQMDSEVKWAPSGQMIVVGPRVIEATTGHVLVDQLPQHTFWSPDSRYLLLNQPDHPFTTWGTVSLLELATGKRLDLGHGQGLGWTPHGEALLVRWDVSKEIPAPGKDC